MPNTQTDPLLYALYAWSEMKDARLAALGPNAVIPGEDDMLPFVHLFKNNQLLGIIIVEGGRDEALDAVFKAVSGLELDRVYLMLDAHMTKLEPEASLEEWEKTYQPGQMQRQCHEEDACATGTITDCLLAHESNKNGPMRMVLRPYRLFADERRIEWSDHEMVTDQEGSKLDGLVPNALRQIMAAPTMFEGFCAEMEALTGRDVHEKISDEEGREICMSTTLAHLSNQGHILSLTQALAEKLPPEILIIPVQ